MSQKRRPTVLVVDDAEFQRDLMLLRLREEGHRVIGAATGEEALELLDGVGVALVDYQLPRSSGLDLLEAIRSRADPPAVVIVTGMGSEAVAVEAIRAGAADYVIKDPGFLDTLPRVVDRVWRHREAERRATRLQDLVVSVAGATERETLFQEILDGARELLDAESSALYLCSERGPELASWCGPGVGHQHHLVRDVREAGGRGGVVAHEGRLVVTISTGEDEPLGGIVVVDEPGRDYSGADVGLARTFAAFAGTALLQLRRVELERALVAELQRSLDQRRDLIASVSHDLRTPLTCIVGFTDTLARRWSSLPEDERRSLVGAIDRNGRRMHDLVERLLDLSHVESGRLEVRPERVDLPAVVRDVVADLASIIGDRHVEVDVPSLTVVADRALLKQILTNLLSNAAKYSPAPRPIRVRAVADLDREQVGIDVIDEGEGLDTEEAQRVFDPFWRGAHAKRQAVSGSGIGLALVKEYARLMAGSVAVESARGVGSTFSVWLPLGTEGAGTLAPAPREAPGTSVVR